MPARANPARPCAGLPWTRNTIDRTATQTNPPIQPAVQPIFSPVLAFISAASLPAGPRSDVSSTTPTRQFSAFTGTAADQPSDSPSRTSRLQRTVTRQRRERLNRYKHSVLPVLARLTDAGFPGLAPDQCLAPNRYRGRPTRRSVRTESARDSASLGTSPALRGARSGAGGRLAGGTPLCGGGLGGAAIRASQERRIDDKEKADTTRPCLRLWRSERARRTNTSCRRSSHVQIAARDPPSPEPVRTELGRVYLDVHLALRGQGALSVRYCAQRWS